MTKQYVFWFFLFLALPEGITGAEKPAAPPGVVIDHSPASSRQYIGSPSLAVWTDGRYIASHDLFGPGSTGDRTIVLSSGDQGKHWERLAEIRGQWWSTLFFHRGSLYLMGTSKENGCASIRRSTDGGRSWTTPADSRTGLLLGDGGYHCAPVPVVLHGERIWRAMEDTRGPDGWGSHFRSFLMSAPEDSDLLQAASWTFSNRLDRNPEWLGGKFGGWLEGNAVVAPEGNLVNLLRVDYRPGPEKAARVEVSADGRQVSFDPQSGFIDFPGGCKKFTVRRDPAGPGYWALANYVPEFHRSGNPERVRNTLALLHSADLRTWEVRSVLLHHPDTATHGFQYPDWLFEGSDIIAVVRTAFDDPAGGAPNQHDANYLTFHRFRNFRQRTMKDSPASFRRMEGKKP